MFISRNGIRYTDNKKEAEAYDFKQFVYLVTCRKPGYTKSKESIMYTRNQYDAAMVVNDWDSMGNMKGIVDITWEYELISE